MAYNGLLAGRMRMLMGTEVSEKQMFGGVAFFVGGNLCSGIIGDELIVRVGPDQHPAALAQPHARPFDYSGRPMVGWVYISEPGWRTDKSLKAWLERGLAFARSLPAKGSGAGAIRHKTTRSGAARSPQPKRSERATLRKRS